jgi:hypothetical protein
MKTIVSSRPAIIATLFLLVFLLSVGFSRKATACAFCEAMRGSSAKMTNVTARSKGTTLTGGNPQNSLTPSEQFFKPSAEPQEQNGEEQKVDQRNRGKSEIVIVRGIYGE